jgi:hypothetical protein
MSRLRPIAALAALLLATVTGAAVPPPAPSAATAKDTGAKALAILARTKTATGTYALYLWNRLTPPDGPPREEWSAEFNAGDLHRVETPRDRLVANCRTGEGHAYSVETGQSFEGPWIARTACGVDTNAPFASAAWEGEMATPFGQADRVRIVTAELVRRYDVSRDGILLGTVYSDNSADRMVRLINWPIAVERTLPASGIFDRPSLARSYVPDRYKRAPSQR